MNGARVVEVLNKAMASELTAIHQYMAQHYKLEDAGFGVLAGQIKAIALTEMKHAESVALRIRLLGGVPTSALDADIKLDEAIPAALTTDIDFETKAVDNYRQFAAVALEEGDHVSHCLLTDILNAEEQHLKEFQTVAAFVAKLGQPYLVSLVGE